MKILIKAATIIDKNGLYHKKKRDILVDKGRIDKIAFSIEDPKAKIISIKNVIACPGFVDMKANFCDPGHEDRETLETGINAARKGGYRYVMTSPMTSPVVDSKSQVNYILSKTTDSDVKIFPVACLSKGAQGKQMSEMFDMWKNGAIAFSDDMQHVPTELMVRSLEYSRNFNGMIITYPLDREVNPKGMMHEGNASVQMGVKGLSNISEEIRIKRDLDLVRYTGGRIHFSLISTAGAVKLIRQAKKEGLNVTCSIAAHQLSFTDKDLMDFDSLLKVLPPFRTPSDRRELIAGIKDGTIDAICSDHQPLTIEQKQLEFEYADYGISSIQYAFSTFYTQVHDTLSIETIIDKFTSSPAKVLNLEEYGIYQGSDHGLTLIDINSEIEVTKEGWESQSFNSPFLGKKLKGRIVQIS
ncbi:MAG: dihydroorotase [Flavobacteriales bacterium]